MPARVASLEQRLKHDDARTRDVLLEPLCVLGADSMMMREGRAVVDERLLDGCLHHVVLGERVAARRWAQGEGEIQARPGVIAVREVPHEVATDDEAGKGI